MSTEFKLYIDSDDDGTFSENFSAYLVSMEWRLGFADELQFVAPLSTATIVLDNLSSLVAADVYNHQVRIKGESGAGPTVRTLWTGWGRSVSLSHDFTTLTLECVGIEEPLYTQRVSIPIQLDSNAGDLLDLVIDRVTWRLKILEDVLILDDAVTGELGKDLGGTGITTDFDDGIMTFPYAGDRWDNALAIDIIQDIVSSDGGRFYADRNGDLVFADRGTLIVGSGTSITDVAAIDTTLVTGARKFNASQISFAGRAVGAADSVLFQIDEPLLIRSGTARKLRCRFRDSYSNSIGATVVNPLHAGVDYIANVDGTTTSDTHTDYMSVDAVHEDGNSVTFEIYHDRSYDLYLGAFRVTGTPLAKSDPMTVEILDDVLATKDGVRYVSSSAPLLSSSVLAEDFARFELARRLLSEAVYDLVVADVSLSDALFGATVLDEVEVVSTDVDIFGEWHYVDGRQLAISKYVTGYTWNVYGYLPFDLDETGERSRLS